MQSPIGSVARRFVPFLLGMSAAAQCAPHVTPGQSILGLDSAPSAMAEWDPDGAGPLGVHWVFAGNFFVAGDVLARSVALFDPATGQWSELGGGLNGVSQLLPLPNGELLAATVSSSVPQQSDLWLWRSGQWQLVPGAPIGISAMVRMPNGDVVVGGNFSTAGGQACANIARWNGAGWAPLGNGVSVGATGSLSTSVSALLVDQGGDLWVGGHFTTAGTVAAINVARWDGVAWSPAGSGLQEAVQHYGVRKLAQLPQGDVVALGGFDQVGGVPLQEAARWNGSAWLPMGLDLIAAPSGVALAPNGDLWVVRSGFGIGTANALVRWDGAVWQPLAPNTGPAGSGTHLRCCMVTGSGALVVGGSFQQILGPTSRADSIAVLQGGAWSPVPGVADGLLGGSYLLASVRGETLAIGRLAWAGTQPVGGAAVRSVGGWAPLANSPQVRNAKVACNLANGDLVVGGVDNNGWYQCSLAGQNVGPLVRYDGSTWTGFGGSGMQANPQGLLSLMSLLPMPDGSLIVGGGFSSLAGVPVASIAKWDGLTWLPLGSGISGEVRALTRLPNGHLVAGGSFVNAGGTMCVNVARWDGVSWSPMGAGIGSLFTTRVDALVALPGGDVLAAGDISSTGFLRRWDGSAWVDASGGVPMTVSDMQELPSREVLLAAYLRLGQNSWMPRLLIGDGLSPWRDFAVQPDQAWNDLTPWRVQVAPDGEVLMQSPFRRFAGVPMIQAAGILPGCPAIATVVGSGCAGSNGQDTLTSEVLPWLGGVARARATGLPNEAIVVVTLGLTSPNVTLGSLSPLALPGCQLLAALDFYVLANVSGGSVPIDLPLPLTPALVGASLFEQVLSLGLTGGAPFEATSTNALELQLGLFGG